MSKDIRSFFPVKKSPKVKIEDDDVIPESPDVKKINKKKSLRRKRVLSDDEDDTLLSKKQKSVEELPKSSHKNTQNKSPAKKEVSVKDIFGGASIKRSEPFLKKTKKIETGIHSDDDFDQSLLELDEKEMKLNKTSPIKINNEDACQKAEQQNNIKSCDKSNDIVPNVTPSKSKSNKPLKVEKTDLSKTSPRKINKTKTEFNEFLEPTNNKVETKRKTSKPNESDLDSTVEYEESEFNIKMKKNRSLNESVLFDEERHDRKRHSAQLYQKYLNRTGPKHLGEKEIPEGAPDCLKGCAFLLTGVLDHFERDEIASAISKYGGTVKNSMSKKVTHVLAGEDAGPAKLAKAEELSIKILNEDEFLLMISNKETKKNKSEDKIKINNDKTPSKKSNKSKDEHTNNNKSNNHETLIKDKTNKDKNSKVNLSIENKSEMKIKRDKSKSPNPVKKETKLDSSSKVNDSIKNKSEVEINRDKCKSPNPVKKEIKQETKHADKKVTPDKNKELKQQETSKLDIVHNGKCGLSEMWVEKYKPQSVKQIIGQQGDSSNVRKLTNWLTKWYVNRKAKLAKPSPWAKNDDGGYYKAALLSGPPGVGKTTTVSLVCKELGFDVVEFNASDTRNKALMKEQIGDLLTTNSLSGYAKGDTGKQAVSKKHVLVMDEVDGMAGNEDRGGLQELINLIKSASVPIICMCNDRNHQKMRSLVNYCYDLRFQRPRVEQIKAAMMSICYKEGLKMPPDVLQQLILSANQDLRQTLNLLSMWAVDPSQADADKLRKDAKITRKDVKLGPWEAVRKVFSEEDHKTMSLHDKSDLFFYDYSMAPLFVQENYLQVTPHCPKKELLDRVSKAADSISAGDLVDARIRRNQAWSLLPMQAMYSSVIPGNAMCGHVAGQIQFPGWLGKNSRATKSQRLAQEIHAHTRLCTTGSKSSIFLDYCWALRDAIVTPLIQRKADGVEESLEVLKSYNLMREDLDSLTEIAQWPGKRNPMDLVDSKVKAAMTRTYNKRAAPMPYAPGAIKRVKSGAATSEATEGYGDEEEEEEAGEENSDAESDALIKKVKKPEKSNSVKEKAGSSKEKSSSSKEKKKKK